MRVYALPIIIYIFISIISCGNDTQPSHTQQDLRPNKTEPVAEPIKELLLERIDSFGPDNKRYNDILKLREDCFQENKPTGLLGKKLFVAAIDDKTAGYFGYYLVNPNTAMIHDVCIGTSYRGAGIGTKLLKYGLSTIETMPRITKLILEVVPDNEAAIRLYKSAGFKRIGGAIEPGGRIEFMEKNLYSSF